MIKYPSNDFFKGPGFPPFHSPHNVFQTLGVKSHFSSLLPATYITFLIAL